VGGRSALYLEADGDTDLAAAGAALMETPVPWIVMGKGSNVLVSDRGFAGLVIRLGKGYRWVSRDGTRLRAGGSTPLPALANQALANSLAGLAFGVAIPASLGGAVRMNAGAHGRSMQEVLDRIELYQLLERTKGGLSADQAGLGYRRSGLPEGSIVVGAILALRPGQPGEIRREMQAARDWRRATQPLAEPNCGSVFKNPPGDHAARLVEAAGGKGLTVGGAAVSLKHSNFIVTGPTATAGDVHRLIGLVRDLVESRCGVTLELEVHLVGDFDFAAL